MASEPNLPKSVPGPRRWPFRAATALLVLGLPLSALLTLAALWVRSHTWEEQWVLEHTATRPDDLATKQVTGQQLRAIVDTDRGVLSLRVSRERWARRWSSREVADQA